MTRDGSLSEVLYVDFFINSPFAIAKTTVFGSLVWLLVAGAVAGEAGARDVATGMHPLTYTAPVSKVDYLGGRFLAALILNALILLAVQAGILLGVVLARRASRRDWPVPAGGLSHGLRLHLAAERNRRDGDSVLAGGAERPTDGCLRRKLSPLLHGLLHRLLPAFPSRAGHTAGSDRDPLHRRRCGAPLDDGREELAVTRIGGRAADQPPSVDRHRCSRTRTNVLALSLCPSRRAHSTRLASLPPSRKALPPSPRLRWTSR